MIISLRIESGELAKCDGPEPLKVAPADSETGGGWPPSRDHRVATVRFGWGAGEFIPPPGIDQCLGGGWSEGRFEHHLTNVNASYSMNFFSDITALVE